MLIQMQSVREIEMISYLKFSFRLTHLRQFPFVSSDHQSELP